MLRPMHVGVLISVPLLEFATARRLQRRLCDERITGRQSDTLMLVEHAPVVTLGRTTKAEHWNGQTHVLTDRGIQVMACARGGSVTYHGPGQIVGYPILRLRNFCSGPKVYMRMLEDVLVRVLADWNIEGQRREKFVGVWVRDPRESMAPFAKIAAMGVKISRGVTRYGFALNVAMDLEPFQYIVPCGIVGCRVTSMAEILGTGLDVQRVRNRIAHHFAQVFNVEWTERFIDVPPHFRPALSSQAPTSADVDVGSRDVSRFV